MGCTRPSGFQQATLRDPRLRLPRGYSPLPQRPFIPVQWSCSQCNNPWTFHPRSEPFSAVLRRIPVHSAKLFRQRNFPLAKVGVEGSNPFARSKLPQPFKVFLSGAQETLRCGRHLHGFCTALAPRRRQFRLQSGGNIFAASTSASSGSASVRRKSSSRRATTNVVQMRQRDQGDTLQKIRVLSRCGPPFRFSMECRGSSWGGSWRRVVSAIASARRLPTHRPSSSRIPATARKNVPQYRHRAGCEHGSVAHPSAPLRLASIRRPSSRPPVRADVTR
jgi:hypothetical protein